VEIPRGVLDGLERIAPGQVQTREPMARHTSFGLGGPADVFLEPATASAFKDAAALLDDAGIPIMILGRGTDILVRSGGIDGAVLAARRAFDGIERRGRTLAVGSGVALARVLRLCAEEGLSGIEGLAGIPGSVGGAVVTNAGSFGVAIGERLRDVVLFRPGSDSRAVPAAELAIEYRRAKLPAKAIIEQATLELDEADPGAVRRLQEETLERKWRAQPADMRSAGCVFKNPPGDSAGKLIDSLGLKGVRVGGAVVSDRHANFILNDRGATSEDVEELIGAVRARVREATGIELALEVEIVGRPADAERRTES
jgi:UDP-N-acetylmuramate dehydrogenase